MRQRLRDVIPLGDRARRVPKSDLKRTFRTELINLLKTEHYASSNTNFYRTYVEDPDIGPELDDLYISGDDEIITITGPRGIGKSSILRFKFGLDANARIRDRKLIVPFYVDNYVYKNEFESKLANSLAESAKLISEEFGIKYDAKSVVEFIIKNKASILGTDLLADKNIGAINRGDILLKDLSIDSPVIYYLMLLKFLVVNSPVKDVIFIADDLESATYDFQLSVVMRLLAVRNCLMHTSPFEKNFSAKLVFATRPATHHHFLSDRQANGYSIAREFRIKFPPKVSDVIEKRFNDALYIIESGIRGPLADEFYQKSNKARWEYAYGVVKRIIEQITNRYSYFLSGIANYDVRWTMEIIFDAVSNAYWFEHRFQEEIAGAFKIENNIYHLNDINVIQSIGLKDNFIYDSTTSRIPNVLINYQDPSADLMSFYLMKIFSADYVDDYVQITRNDIKKRLSTIYYDVIVDRYLDRILNYFSDKKRSVIRREIISGVELFISQPSIYYIEKAILESNAFLILYRDDLYLPNDVLRPEIRHVATSLELIERQFLVCLELATYFSLEEKKIISSRIKTSSEAEFFISNFGKRTASNYLYTGLGNSIRRRFGSDIPNDIGKAYINLREIVEDIDSILNQQERV